MVLFRPANFGKDGDAESLTIAPLIVTGAIWEHDEVTRYSGPESGIPHVYAPGIEMKVADGDPAADIDAFETGSKGTSEGQYRILPL